MLFTASPSERVLPLRAGTNGLNSTVAVTRLCPSGIVLPPSNKSSVHDTKNNAEIIR
jgi:hypothetical protein